MAYDRAIEASANMVRLNTALEALVRAEVIDYIEKDVKDLSKYGLEQSVLCC